LLRLAAGADYSDRSDITEHGELTFDPFLGPGTTMSAAKQNGRITYGLEL
jgi:DNA modification methylase